MKKLKVKVSEINRILEAINILNYYGVGLPFEISYDLALTKGNITKSLEIINDEKKKTLDSFEASFENDKLIVNKGNIEDLKKELEELSDKQVSIEMFSFKLSKDLLKEHKLPIRFFELFKNYIK
jgi:hypothetical protein